MKERGEMILPLFSSALYLTGSSADSPRQSERRPQCRQARQAGAAWSLEAPPPPPPLCLRAGPTVVLDQRFDAEQGRPTPESPAASTLVFPLAGSYCLFDGALGHGVLDSGSSERRCTLLVNWWARKPEVGGWGGWVGHRRRQRGGGARASANGGCNFSPASADSISPGGWRRASTA